MPLDLFLFSVAAIVFHSTPRLVKTETVPCPFFFFPSETATIKGVGDIPLDVRSVLIAIDEFMVISIALQSI